MLQVYFRNSRQINVILIDTYSTLNFFYALMFAVIAKVSGKKYIPILRGGNLPALLNSRPRLTRFVFGNAFQLVAPSNYLVTAFRQQGYHVHYIPNFINLGNYSYKERFIASPKLCWVRAFQDIYNPLLAVEILRELVVRGYNATLTMIGPDKGQRSDVEALIQKYDLKNHIKLHGKLSKEEWTALAGECDIFINTTNFDNRPVTIIEAMAIGIPVISTNAGGLPDLITADVDGLLVEKGDRDAFVTAIEMFMANPAKVNSLSKAARMTAESFDWKNVQVQWQKLLSDVV